MIGNRDISSGGYRTQTNMHEQIYSHEQIHSHEHKITKCLHETSMRQPEGSAGAASGGIQQARIQPGLKEEGFSLRDFFAGGFRSLAARFSGFWRRLGEEDGQDMALRESKPLAEAGKAVLTVKEGSKEENDFSIEAEGKLSAAVLGTAMVKPENKRTEIPETARRRVNQVESSKNGGLEKGQGGIRKFLQKFGEAAAEAGRFLGRKKREKVQLSENNTDLNQGDSSFLMDSYNRMGEYSTLAKDRSLEGKFRAKG